jgi:hypothetical protein
MGFYEGAFHALSSAGKTEDWTGYTFFYSSLRRIFVIPISLLQPSRDHTSQTSFGICRGWSSITDAFSDVFFHEMLRRLFPMGWFCREGDLALVVRGLLFFVRLMSFPFISFHRTNAIYSVSLCSIPCRCGDHGWRSGLADRERASERASGVVMRVSGSVGMGGRRRFLLASFPWQQQRRAAFVGVREDGRWLRSCITGGSVMAWAAI